MPTDVQREAGRRRQANKRARDKGEPEPYPAVDREVVQARLNQHEADLEWAKAQDAAGYYKSECRSAVDLLAIYEGGDAHGVEDEEEEGKSKSKKEKKNRPNPSQSKITIRAVEYNGTKLEPNCDFEFRKLTEVDEIVSFRRWLELRDKARKDLFWLGRLLGRSFFHTFHQELCDQFVQKNFGGTGSDGIEVKPLYFSGYTIDDFHDMMYTQKRFANDGVTPTREALILDPRSAYKSTADGVDAVQWMLNCPDVRILIITAFKPLAKLMLKEIKSYFYLPQRGEPKSFHLLFPEYTLTGVDGTSEQPIQCPAANHVQKEPSLWISSIESSSTGMRCDIRKADDVVDPKNSNDEELREKLKFDFNGTDDLTEPWGFTDVIGTRYFTRDWFGTRMLPDENGAVAPFKYHCRGSWVVKPEYRDIKLKQLTEEMVVLLFPYKLSWRYLKNALTKKGERSFRNQQLNDPTDPGEDSAYINQFDEDVLRAHSYPASSAPQEGEVFLAADTAYSDRAPSDFSVLIAARSYQKSDKQWALCILDVQFGKWKSSELVMNIIAFHRKWKPKMTETGRKKFLIEKMLGADLLRDNLMNKSQVLGSTVLQDIWWKPPSTEPNAKRNRVKSLETLLAGDRLYFVNGDWIDEMFKQLTQYNGNKSSAYRKDDIPDAMSYLIEFLPRYALSLNVDPKEAEKEAEEQAQKEINHQVYQRMFGGSSPTAPRPPVPESEAPKPDPRRAILQKIFGGNGLRA